MVDLGYGRRDSKQINGDRDVGDTLVVQLPFMITVILRKDNFSRKYRTFGLELALLILSTGRFQDFGQLSTGWIRGSVVPVIWLTSAYHRGGYAYRLCGPLEKGKEWYGVHEQCFRDGHLSFHGKVQELT